MVAGMDLLGRKNPEIGVMVVLRVLVKVVNYHALRKWLTKTDGGHFVGLASVIMHGRDMASFILGVFIAGQSPSSSATARNTSANETLTEHFRIAAVHLA